MRTCHNCKNLRTLILFPVTRAGPTEKLVCIARTEGMTSTPSLGAKRLYYH